MIITTAIMIKNQISTANIESTYSLAMTSV